MIQLDLLDSKPGDPLISASSGVRYRHKPPSLVFYVVLGIHTQVFKLTQQVCYQLSYLPSPLDLLLKHSQCWSEMTSISMPVLPTVTHLCLIYAAPPQLLPCEV